MSSKDDDDDKNEIRNENESEYDGEPIDQSKTNEIIKGENDLLDEIIDKSKSFEEQIKSLKQLEGLKGHWSYEDFGNKELKSKYFKIKLANMSNDIEERLFKQIFGHTLIKLANKLINTTDKKKSNNC